MDSNKSLLKSIFIPIISTVTINVIIAAIAIYAAVAVLEVKLEYVEKHVNSISDVLVEVNKNQIESVRRAEKVNQLENKIKDLYAKCD